MLRKIITRTALLAVLGFIFWIIVNPLGIRDLPWGWGKSQGQSQAGCSLNVVRVHQASQDLLRRWPKVSIADVTAQSEVAHGPVQGSGKLSVPSITTEGDSLVFIGPAGDYVWESSTTDGPCAGLIHVDAGRATQFDSRFVHLRS